MALKIDVLITTLLLQTIEKYIRPEMYAGRGVLGCPMFPPTNPL